MHGAPQRPRIASRRSRALRAVQKYRAQWGRSVGRRARERAARDLRMRLWRTSCREPMLWLAGAAALGILLDHLVFSNVALWLAAVAIWVAVACVAGQQRRWYIAPLVIVPLFAARHAVDRQRYESASVMQVLTSEGQPAIVEVTVDRPATLQPHPLAGYASRRDQSPWQTEFECRLQRIRVGRGYQPIDGRLLVAVDGRCDHYRPGNVLRLYGELRAPQQPTNPGERDMRLAYRMRRLHGHLTLSGDDRIEVLTSARRLGSGWIAHAASSSRETLLEQTAASTGGLAVALVVGQRDFVDAETRDLLLITGTAHLLSVSGLHLAIVVLLARWVGTVFRFPPLIQLAWLAAVGLLYASMTGFRPPVMRASILVAVFVLSMLLRRTSRPINTLAFAALVLLAWNPVLILSVGVQLSFVAVATLLLCGQRQLEGWSSFEDAAAIQKRLRDLADASASRPTRVVRWLSQRLFQAVWYSGCVTAITLPLVWHQFHVVSPISVLTNVCMSVPMTIGLASGIATVIAAPFSATLASLPGFVCDQSLVVMLAMVRGFAAVPYGHVWLPAPPTAWVAIFYLVTALTLALRPSRAARRGRMVWVGFWILGGWLLATTPAPLPEGSVEATFVDVGHGTSVVVRLAEQEVWLYDCGRLGNRLGSTANVDGVLWSLGVTRLQGVMISHADTDHYNALPALLRRFAVTGIHAPPSVFNDQEALLHELRLQIEELGIPLTELHRGMTIEAAGAELSILHPPRERLAGSDNANSLVVVVETGQKPLILPGDVEPPGVEVLLHQPRPRPGGVLMAPHHGSLQLDMRPVLDWSRPSHVVVSGGDRAAQPAVSAALSMTGAATWVTAERGAVRVRIDRTGQLEIRSWLEAPW